jgi:hypothetical protein
MACLRRISVGAFSTGFPRSRDRTIFARSFRMSTSVFEVKKQRWIKRLLNKVVRVLGFRPTGTF